MLSSSRADREMFAAAIRKSGATAAILVALAAPLTAQMTMEGGGDWKTAAMAKHMAYSRTRPRTPQDSVRSAYIINELRQAIAKYRDVKVPEDDGYKMFA